MSSPLMTASRPIQMLFMCASVFLGSVFFVAVVVPPHCSPLASSSRCGLLSWRLRCFLITEATGWQRALSNKDYNKAPSSACLTHPAGQQLCPLPVACATATTEPSCQTRSPAPTPTAQVPLHNHPICEQTNTNSNAAAPAPAPMLPPSPTAPAYSPPLRPQLSTLPPSSCTAPKSPASASGAADCTAALVSSTSMPQPQPTCDGAAGCGPAQSQPLPRGRVEGMQPDGVAMQLTGVTSIQPNPAMDGSWLASCVEQYRLGQGSFGHVDLVLVNLPGAGQFRAARKSMMINDDNLHAFEAEIHGLREAVGCTDIVQLYDVRTTETHFELLLELMKGGSVAQELAGAGTQHGGAWPCPQPRAHPADRRGQPPCARPPAQAGRVRAGHQAREPAAPRPRRRRRPGGPGPGHALRLWRAAQQPGVGRDPGVPGAGGKDGTPLDRTGPAASRLPGGLVGRQAAGTDQQGRRLRAGLEPVPVCSVAGRPQGLEGRGEGLEGRPQGLADRHYGGPAGVPGPPDGGQPGEAPHTPPRAAAPVPDDGVAAAAGAQAATAGCRSKAGVTAAAFADHSGVRQLQRRDRLSWGCSDS